MEKETKSIYSDAQKQRDTESIIASVENIVSNYASIATLARRWNYPRVMQSELLELTDGLCNAMFLLANFVQNPAAADIVSDLADRKSKMEMQLLDIDDPDNFLAY